MEERGVGRAGWLGLCLPSLGSWDENTSREVSACGPHASALLLLIREPLPTAQYPEKTLSALDANCSLGRE